MENLTDEELAILSKNGDVVALETLFAKYKNLTNKIARSYFLVGSEFEDILQEASIGLYKAILSYSAENKKSFAMYAKLCVTNRVYTAIKKANTQKNLILNKCVSLSTNPASEDNHENAELYVYENVQGPDQKLQSKDNLIEIKKLINEILSGYEMQIFVLYLSGLGYVEIAKKLDTSAKSIDNALNRIKTKLSFLKQI